MQADATQLFSALLLTESIEGIREKMRSHILQDIENSKGPEEAFRGVQNLRYLNEFFTHMSNKYNESKTQKERDYHADRFESRIK